MPLDLQALLDPRTTAVVNSEAQNGVIGPGSPLPELAAAAQDTVVPNGARLVRAARAAGVPVLHGVAGRRPDDRGSNRNARLFMALLRPGAPRIDLDTPAADIVPEIGVDPSDLVVARIAGLNPMSGTGLDAILRNLGVRTVVIFGVSVNVAITNFVMDAVNLGYQVVLPRDAVAGVPASYADAVIDNTLSLLATVVTTDDVLTAWESARVSAP